MLLRSRISDSIPDLKEGGSILAYAKGIETRHNDMLNVLSPVACDTVRTLFTPQGRN
jgi:hypothetical protein